MRGALVGIVVVMLVGFGVYSWQAGRLGDDAGAGSPAQIVDSVGVRTDLQSMARAQREQFTVEGKYLSLEALRAKGVTLPARRGGYVYSAEVTDTTFTITATWTGREGDTPQPTLTIGPDMEVRQVRPPG